MHQRSSVGNRAPAVLRRSERRRSFLCERRRSRRDLKRAMREQLNRGCGGNVARRAKPGWRPLSWTSEASSARSFVCERGEEGSGSQAPASASGASSIQRSGAEAFFLCLISRCRRSLADRAGEAAVLRRSERHVLRLRVRAEGSGRDLASGASNQTRREQLQTMPPAWGACRAADHRSGDRAD